MIKVLIPTPLRNSTGNLAELSIDAKTVSDAVNEIEKLYSGFKDRVYKKTWNDESEKFKEVELFTRFLIVYVNEEDIKYLQNEKTELKDGDVISIIPAISGGN